MTKLLVSLILLLYFQPVIAQNINFPDEKLKQVLIGSECADIDGDGEYDGPVDTNDDNEISVAEAEAVIGLRLLRFDIVDPEGLQFFVNLTFLRLGNNDIAAFDLSPFTKLTVFDCSSNELTQLDLSNNPTLIDLDCSGNNIQALDVSESPDLKVLDIGANMISEIDLDTNRALEKIVLGSNQFTDLVINDFPNLNALSILPNELTKLEISNNPSLINLKFRGQLNRNDELLDVKITDNKNLESVIFELVALKKLDLSNNNITNLEHYSESTLEYFDISDNEAFYQRFLYRNSLEYIDVSNTALTGIQIFGNVDYFDFNTNVPIAVNLHSLESDIVVNDQTSIEFLSIKFDDRSILHNVQLSNIPNLNELKIDGEVDALALVDFPELKLLEVNARSLDLVRVGLQNLGFSNFITDDIQVSDYLNVEECDSLSSIHYRGNTKIINFIKLDNLRNLVVDDSDIDELLINLCTIPYLEFDRSTIGLVNVTENDLDVMRLFAGKIDQLNIEDNLGLANLDSRSIAAGTLNIINNRPDHL